MDEEKKELEEIILDPEKEEPGAEVQAQDPEPGPADNEETSAGNKGRKSRGWKKFVGGFALGFAACIGVFAVLMYGFDLGRVIPTEDYEYFDDLNDKYGKYYMIMDMIGEDPLIDVKPEDLTEDSIRKIIEDLDDPYAVYYSEEEYAAFRKTFEGDYVGVGIMVEQTEEGLRVADVFEGGPAEGAGMKPGDMIIRVDGIEPENIDDAVSRMTGESGTEVTVTVERDGQEIDLKMTRKPIELDSVYHFVTELDPEVGYIGITLFTEDTDEEFKEAVEDLKKEGCDKFILDLRDNGGGITDASINIADYLLPECTIMTEVNKKGEEKVYKSEASSEDLEMVILVNENTASASEILTAALKENGAGTVIGEKTFGKGVTQISRQFRDGTAIKITVTEYLTPKGNHVQDKGIDPDIDATADDIMDKAYEELRD